MSQILSVSYNHESFVRFIDDVRLNDFSRGKEACLGKIGKREMENYQSLTGITPTSSEIMVKDKLLVGPKASRHLNKGDGLSDEEWRLLPTLFITFKNNRAYLDRTDNNLIYLFPSVSPTEKRVIRLVINVNFKIDQKKQINSLRSAFKINSATLDTKNRYHLL
ncbi:MAG: hypothetical protein QM537_01990 [Candidatus Symbiobacter sp.]|nr:hypothetical protein [Candidatus Symbiobacter sp.]